MTWESAMNFLYVRLQTLQDQLKYHQNLKDNDSLTQVIIVGIQNEIATIEEAIKKLWGDK